MEERLRLLGEVCGGGEEDGRWRADGRKGGLLSWWFLREDSECS